MPENEEEKLEDVTDDQSLMQNIPTANPKRDWGKIAKNVAYGFLVAGVVATDLFCSLHFGTQLGTGIASQAMDSLGVVTNFRENLNKTKAGRFAIRAIDILTSKTAKRLLTIGLISADIALTGGAVTTIIAGSFLVANTIRETLKIQKIETNRKKAEALLVINESRAITQELTKDLSPEMKRVMDEVFPPKLKKETSALEPSKPVSYIRSLLTTIAENIGEAAVAIGTLDIPKAVSIIGLGLWKETEENHSLSKFGTTVSNEVNDLSHKCGVDKKCQ